MVTRWWDKYYNYLVNSLALEGKAKIEAERQIKAFEMNPNPTIALMQAEGEIEHRNMFWVLEKALPKIQEDSIWNEIDPDKMKRLKDLSKDFSSEDMQELIAWILAWEYNKPWTYSMQTMSVVQNLSKWELELFKKFCEVVINKEFIFWEIFWFDHENRTQIRKEWILYEDYLYLQELWLVTWNDSAKKIGIKSIWVKQPIIFSIWNQSTILFMDKEIVISGIKNLTLAGKQLLNLITIDNNNTLFEIIKADLIKQWFEQINSLNDSN